ncbi:hypothetical protein Q5P01_016526 [Channa striata]|uniref:Uncharacterized protein n=1 Tax=Channa striata TaxID=64152 RepID=A0AA88MH42_CHASR|nr:hypothetical protein Q5P01_016526 [Channa striata]
MEHAAVLKNTAVPTSRGNDARTPSSPISKDAQVIVTRNRDCLQHQVYYSSVHKYSPISWFLQACGGNMCPWNMSRLLATEED